MDHEDDRATTLLRALTTASAQLASQPYTVDIGPRVVEQAAQMLAVGDARLVLVDTDPRWLVLQHAVGGAAARVGTRQSSTEGVLGEVVRSGEALRVAEVGSHAWDCDATGPSTPGSVLAVPIRVAGGVVLGALAVAREREQPPFTAVDQMALQMLGDLVPSG